MILQVLFHSSLEDFFLRNIMKRKMIDLLLYLAVLPFMACGGSSESDEVIPTPDSTPISVITDSTVYKPTSKDSIPTTYEGMTLAWHDEFDTDGLPSSQWTAETGFQRNEELQWYQGDNAEVKDGCMIITGKVQRVPNIGYVEGSSDWKTSRKYAEYTSSSMTTQNSFSFRYGRMEVRAKIPTSTGSWPAIWLLGTDWEWPNNGEIDVLEYYIKNGVPSILSNACWGSPRQWEAVWNEGVIPFTHFTSKDTDWSKKFHVWRMDWDEKNIKIYLDDELLNDIDLSTTSNQGFNGNTENPFTTAQIKHYILLNLAIGGNGGTPDTSAFPLRYYIDYVRVYQ